MNANKSIINETQISLELSIICCYQGMQWDVNLCEDIQKLIAISFVTRINVNCIKEMWICKADDENIIYINIHLTKLFTLGLNCKYFSMPPFFFGGGGGLKIIHVGQLFSVCLQDQPPLLLGFPL